MNRKATCVAANQRVASCSYMLHDKKMICVAGDTALQGANVCGTTQRQFVLQAECWDLSVTAVA